MLDEATAYAEAVEAGRVLAGPSVRAACGRHLADLRHGEARGLRWDVEKAQRAIEFFPDILRLPQVGLPFKLSPFQAFKTGCIFGWTIAATGYRRFRIVYDEEAKGNGKSPWCAGVGLYMLVADGEQGAECYAAAVTREQAQICFQDAVTMVHASADLSERLLESGRAHVYNLAHLRSGSFFRPISSEGKSLDGKRVHFAGIDELHEHPTGIVVGKLRDGLKGRRQGLILMITNSGVDRHSVCFQYHEYAKRVLAGIEKDDEFFAFITDLDPGDTPLKDESCWPKANPNLGISVTREYLRSQVRAASGMPAEESRVLRMNFCNWVDAENPWLSQEIWEKVQVKRVDIRASDVFGGLDLSGTKDLTALALRGTQRNGRAGARVEFWTPGDTIHERSKADRVQYDLWRDQQFVHTTPGRAVNYAFVAQRLIEIKTEIEDGGGRLVGVACDPYRIKYLERELDTLGAEILLIPHPQGFRKSAESAQDGLAYQLWMPHSINLLEQRLGEGGLDIERNPCLTWNIASAVIEQDEKENKIFTKRRSRGRIDGAVALAIAEGYMQASSAANDGDMDGWLSAPAVA